MSDTRLTMLESEVARQRALLADLLAREVGLSVTGSGAIGATGVAGTAVTLLAAGTIAYAVTLVFVVHAVTGADASGGTVTLECGDSYAIYNDGTDVLTLALSAGGQLTVQRTGGADTFNVNCMGVWL